jgi:hypothetical protein
MSNPLPMLYRTPYPWYIETPTHDISNRIPIVSQQPENCENRNDPDLVQAFLKKWWVESNFKAPNLPLSLRSKSPAVVR